MLNQDLQPDEGKAKVAKDKSLFSKPVLNSKLREVHPIQIDKTKSQELKVSVAVMIIVEQKEL